VATPDEGAVFVEWLGDLTGTDASTSLLMNTPKTVTAVFADEEDITPDAVPEAAPDVAVPDQKQESDVSSDAKEPEEIITTEPVPQGATPELPKTGGVPSILFILSGVPAIVAGLKLKKKEK
jgi:LPXTG-motif cell wall-anchored protein